MSGKRGFAAMSLAKRKIISSLGGKSAHAKGTAYVFTSEAARAAGSKGGSTTAQDRRHMAKIGRRGGDARKGK